MKKLLVFFLSLSVLFTSFVYAEGTEDYVTREEIFIDIFSQLEAPKSYQYIDLYYEDVEEGTELYDAMQKAVYFDLFVNAEIRIAPSKNMSQYIFMQIAEKLLDRNFVTDEELAKLKNTYVTEELLQELIDMIRNSKKGSTETEEGLEMVMDIYKTIFEEYYYKGELDKDDLIYAAVAGMLTEVDDKYTKFFPPELSKDFLEQVNSSYEGIGIYFEVNDNGRFLVKDVIKGGPAEEAGLEAGDIILKVDGKDISELEQDEVISLIKGEEGTSVELYIKRVTRKFNVTVNREKIVIPTVESEVMEGNTYYIDINSFGEHTAKEFEESLIDLQKKNGIKRIIFDFRDNPGGYLDQCMKMLDTMIKKGEDLLVIEYSAGEYKVQSKGTGLLNLDEYEVYILVNKGTASASEVIAGVLKDYYDDITILGEITYGKGSVQSFKTYNDGSSFKYTIAKWFVGKSRIGIDEIGIVPDVEVKLDLEQAEKGIDNQLDAVFDN